MIKTTWVEDAIIYLFLVGFIQLYAMVIHHQLETKFDAGVCKRVVSRFRKYSILLVTYITGVGVAHQLGFLEGVRAYVLLGLAGILFAVGLYALRRVLRSA